MRTIIDLPLEQVRALDAYREQEGISRAEAVRRAVASFLPPPARRIDYLNHPAFGSSKACRKLDASERVRRIREEWD